MWKCFVCGLLSAAMPLAAAVPAGAQEQAEGRIIQVAPDPGPVAQEADEPAQQMPAYWIGLLGGPVSDELRAHLELPAEQGILVREVVSDSPAAQAGIQQYDILLRAGGDELTDMQDLVNHVVEAGEAEGEVELELIRRGRQETVKVAPEQRPERPPVAGGFPGAPGLEGRQFPGLPFRNLGPNVQLGQPFAPQQIPAGVSITMKREGDQPAEITVKRGDEQWTMVGDDPESLEQLPEDLRPLVANMTRGPGVFHQFVPPAGGFQPFGGEVQERMEVMERRMRELEEQMLDRQRDEN